jgi:LmbE family N-acetylglucosaminyl deacetylase
MRAVSVDVVYISPHADDVAFSAAAQVARDVAAGSRVGVLTLFEMPAKPGAIFGDRTTRSDEDAVYAALAGVEPIRAGFQDAVVRNQRYRNPHQLLAPLAEDERPLVEAVRAKLEAVVRAGCRRVVAPLGIGEHVDHQIAHEAARSLSGPELAFYEDTPHVLTGYQLARRLARLGLQATSRHADAVGADADRTLRRGSALEEVSAMASTWRSMPLIDMAFGVAPGSPRPWWLGIARFFAVAYLVAPYLFSSRTCRRDLRPAAASIVRGPEVVTQKLAAIGAYPSQWPGFRPTLDEWRDALEAYARDLGEDGVVERVWSLLPP